MSEYSRLITLIELLSVAVFSCYVGAVLWPVSAIAAAIFFLLACLPLYAIGVAAFTKNQVIKAPMEDFVTNLIVIFVAIGCTSNAPELAALTYSTITLAAIDLCVNILNFFSPQKEYLTYKNSSIHKTAGILAISEWILMVALCAGIIWSLWGNFWWIAPVVLTVIYLILTPKKNPGNSAPIGGIILDLTLLAYGAILYFEEPAHHAIILCFMLITAIDFARCIMRKTCTISNLDQI